jgi:hypothetical protein
MCELSRTHLPELCLSLQWNFKFTICAGASGYLVLKICTGVYRHPKRKMKRDLAKSLSVQRKKKLRQWEAQVDMYGILRIL